MLWVKWRHGQDCEARGVRNMLESRNLIDWLLVLLFSEATRVNSSWSRWRTVRIVTQWWDTQLVLKRNEQHTYKRERKQKWSVHWKHETTQTHFSAVASLLNVGRGSPYESWPHSPLPKKKLAAGSPFSWRPATKTRLNKLVGTPRIRLNLFGTSWLLVKSV